MPPVELRRHLAVDGTRNLRDTGGYPAVDGRRMRWRTLLRTDALTLLPARAREELREIGLRHVLDLRWPDELALSPNVFAADPVIRYSSIPLLPDDPGQDRGLEGTYCYVLDERWQQLGDVVRALLEPDGLPVVIGCAAGKDRTGITIALLLALCGVPDEVIVEDYALSEAAFAGPNPAVPRHDWRYNPVGVESPPEAMASALRHLEREHGGARPLLRAIGFRDDELDALVEALTEPSDTTTAHDRAGA